MPPGPLPEQSEATAQAAGSRPTGGSGPGPREACVCNFTRPSTPAFSPRGSAPANLFELVRNTPLRPPWDPQLGRLYSGRGAFLQGSRWRLAVSAGRASHQGDSSSSAGLGRRLPGSWLRLRGRGATALRVPAPLPRGFRDRAVLLPSSGWRPGMLPDILSCPGRPPPETVTQPRHREG